MPVELKELVNDRRLEVHLSGKLDKEDYETVQPAVERLVKQYGKFRMLVEMHDFHGWTAGALWEKITFDATHFNNIERLAIVGETKWHKEMTAFCRPFTAAIVRFSDHNKAAEARDWLAGV